MEQSNLWEKLTLMQAKLWHWQSMDGPSSLQNLTWNRKFTPDKSLPFGLASKFLFHKLLTVNSSCCKAEYTNVRVVFILWWCQDQCYISDTFLFPFGQVASMAAKQVQSSYKGITWAQHHLTSQKFAQSDEFLLFLTILYKKQLAE